MISLRHTLCILTFLSSASVWAEEAESVSTPETDKGPTICAPADSRDFFYAPTEVPSSEANPADMVTSRVIAYSETAKDGQAGATLAEQFDIKRSDEKKKNILADVASRIMLHGYAQGQYLASWAGGKASNTFLCKRTLLWANAQITNRWSFLFMHDFSSVVQEYYTDFRITKNNLLTVRLGQFKHGLSFENPLSPTAMETIDVYSEGVTYLTGCGSDPLNGVQYGRDQGLALFGETTNRLFRYEVEVLNGTGINVRDRDNRKNVVARLELRPCSQLNICATGQLGWGNALVSSPIFNPTIKEGDIYRRDRFTIGADYKGRMVNAHCEYLQGKDGDVTSLGAYLTGSVTLFPNFDIVASYDYFNFNITQKQDMHKVVVGAQYWFFKKCRFQVQYVFKNAHTDYTTFFDRKAHHQIMCQMQVRFN